MAKKEIDIFDLLPEEAIKKVDEIGYTFLSEQGFDTKGAAESNSKRAKLKKELKKQGKELFYRSAVDKETKAILIWFELCKGGETIATSQGIKFLPKTPKGGEGGK